MSDSLGAIMVRMSIPGHSFFEATVENVEQNIHMLMGLNALDKFGVCINDVKDLLIYDRNGWKIPLTRKEGHIYFEWEIEVLFTVEELRRIHAGFQHPANEKLFNLIRHAEPEDAMA